MSKNDNIPAPPKPLEAAKAASKNEVDKEVVKAEKEEKRAAAVKKVKEKKPPYTVAEGRAVTCLKGILSDGEEIRLEWVSGGQETIDYLVEKNIVDDNR